MANRKRRRLPAAGDERHPEEGAVEIAGEKHRLRHALDRGGVVLDISV